MTPDFFKIGFSVDVENGAPWTMSLQAKQVFDAQKCAQCRAVGLRPWHFEGPGIANGLMGNAWGDIIGAGTGSLGPAFMVSERVVNALVAADIREFQAFPVSIASIDSPSLRRSNMPNYFHLSIVPGISVAYVSKAGRPNVCPECGRPRGRFEIHKELPQKETWAGTDLFEGWNAAGPFCTRKIILLARENRWTNFVFKPIDVSRNYRGNWNGIDYLDKNWPPKWYPPRPSDGKTLDEWLADYFSEGETQEDYKRAWNAERAIEDIGAEALPPLLERFHQGNEGAAQAIYSLACQGAPIPSALHERVEQIVFQREYEWNPQLFEKDEVGRLRRKTTP